MPGGRRVGGERADRRAHLNSLILNFLRVLLRSRDYHHEQTLIYRSSALVVDLLVACPSSKDRLFESVAALNPWGEQLRHLCLLFPPTDSRAATDYVRLRQEPRATQCHALPEEGFPMGVYESLGLEPIINAAGSVTRRKPMDRNKKKNLRKMRKKSKRKQRR